MAELPFTVCTRPLSLGREVVDLLAGVPPALHLEEPVRRLLRERQAFTDVLVNQLGEGVVPGHGGVSPRTEDCRARATVRSMSAGWNGLRR